MLQRLLEGGWETQNAHEALRAKDIVASSLRKLDFQALWDNIVWIITWSKECFHPAHGPKAGFLQWKPWALEALLTSLSWTTAPAHFQEEGEFGGAQGGKHLVPRSYCCLLVFMKCSWVIVLFFWHGLIIHFWHLIYTGHHFSGLYELSIIVVFLFPSSFMKRGY